MMEGQMIALGPCFACGRIFQFDPETVVSLPIDPETGTTPDLCECVDKAACAARSIRQPLCVPCCRAFNPRRVAAGLAPFPVPEDDE